MGASPLRSRTTLEQQSARPLARTLVVPGGPSPATARSLPLGVAPIDAVLPDGGLPRGVVVELSSAAGLGRATSVALAACAASQAEARRLADDSSCDGWCAWLDTSHTLFAPGMAHAGVDLERLLVVRPTAEEIARIAVRVATSHIFSLIVVDRCGVPGAELARQRTRWNIATRRLALAIEGSETTVVLLSSARESRAQPLPVALRIELSRPSVQRASWHITKERYGRVGSHSLALAETAAG